MKTIYNTFFFLLLVNVGFAQTIPNDSLYLGQIPPGNIPEVFKLQVSPEHFAAERITISNDGKEIFYSEIKSYYPINSARIKNYRFTGGKWTGPFVLFEDFCSPSLSVTGDTMYFENDTAEAYFSVKMNLKWSAPKRILPKLDRAHYMQVTNKGNQYISSKPVETIGISDWCKLKFTSVDTTVVGLGVPLNTAWDNLDFFVSRDESYMIVTTPFGLSISYPKNDGNWTNPRNLGAKINFGLGMWGPYVTPDNKYLFYTTGTKPDYSDVAVYWVRVDNIIDSLKHTNLSPYIKSLIQNQTAVSGKLFTFTVPDNIFFDDDSKVALTYSAQMADGNPIPSWILFDPATKTFSGTPAEPGELTIFIVVTDSDTAFAFCPVKIIISANPGN